ncbi:hypothetical protein ACE1TI_01225 [Alteribacillus sp. JSM 102045]
MEKKLDLVLSHIAAISEDTQKLRAEVKEVKQELRDFKARCMI